jgi:parvulin-like peptidyl-prolyl isomerase
VAAAVEAAGEGGDTAPITIGGKVLIFHVDEIRPGRQRTVEEVQDMIEEQIFRERLRETQERWISRLRRDAHIRILL